MPTVDFTLEDLKQVFATKVELGEVEQRLSGKIDALDGRIDTLDGRIETLDGRIGTLGGRIDVLDGRVDSLGESLAGKLDRITTMLEEDARAESRRLTRVENRLNRHIANHGR